MFINVCEHWCMLFVVNGKKINRHSSPVKLLVSFISAYACASRQSWKGSSNCRKLTYPVCQQRAPACLSLPRRPTHLHRLLHVSQYLTLITCFFPTSAPFFFMNKRALFPHCTSVCCLSPAPNLKELTPSKTDLLPHPHTMATTYTHFCLRKKKGHIKFFNLF